MPWPAFAERYAEVELGHRRVRRAGGRRRARRRRPHRPRPPRPAAAGPPLRHRRRAAGPPDRLHRGRPGPPLATRPTAPTSARSWPCCRASASSPASSPRASSAPARASTRWTAGGSASSATSPAGRRPTAWSSCVALARAGVVHFLGGDLEVVADARRRPLRGPRPQRPGGRSRRSASSRPGCPRPTCAAPATSWCAAWSTGARAWRSASPDEDDGDGISTGRLDGVGRAAPAARSRRAARTRAGSPSAPTPAGPRPGRSPGPAPTPRRSASTTPPPGPSSCSWPTLAAADRVRAVSAGRARGWAG